MFASLLQQNHCVKYVSDLAHYVMCVLGKCLHVQVFSCVYLAIFHELTKQCHIVPANANC